MLDKAITRRRADIGLLGVPLVLGVGGSGCATDAKVDLGQQLAALETEAGGKLGATILNTRTGAQINHRGDERFGMCSSFKLALAAIILREVDQGRLALDTFVPIGPTDMVYYAPAVTKNLDKGGMTVSALAEAAQVLSDNVAANKLLGLIGGPAGFTKQMRSLGDRFTRLDRLEPELNNVTPGDPRDTTTPDAMAMSLAKMLTTNWLSASSRALLLQWMEKTATGTKRIRAELPPAWRSGNKTGTGLTPNGPDRYNDVAITWPTIGPNAGTPYVITAFYESPVNSEEVRDLDQAVLASVGQLAAVWIKAGLV
jgi:beta-lactamase class A